MRAARNDQNYFPRQDVQKSTVFNLVYRYLNEIANRNQRLKQQNCACNSFQRAHARRKDIHRRNFADLDKRINHDKISKSRMNKYIFYKSFKIFKNLKKKYRCFSHKYGNTL